jgi:hypothetical protein
MDRRSPFGDGGCSLAFYSQLSQLGFAIALPAEQQIEMRDMRFPWSNHQVEATAPRAGRLVRPMFYNVIVPGGAALPGAVPHLGRSVQ